MATFLKKITEHPRVAKIATRSFGVSIAAALIAILVLMIVFDHEPEQFDVLERATARANASGQHLVTGYVTTNTLIEVAETLFDKRGGYLSNDVMPPGVLMDNVPNWEWGVLVQVRDLAVALRNHLSRSQTQSTEDPDLTRADNRLRIDSEAWMFPAAETEYREGLAALDSYLNDLAADSDPNAQFYARADNLRDWLATVEKRLGDLSQRLSASVGQVRINTDLAGDAEAEQATQAPSVVVVKTAYFEIDDVFYEARGATWALIHFLHAVEHDFKSVLQKKNASVSLRQIIRELEGTQETVWSPVILNGRGFGLVANHSLVMASYVSRANAGVIDLRNLLERG